MAMSPSHPETAPTPVEIADAVAVLEAEPLSAAGRAALALLRDALLTGMVSPFARLTARQREVARLLAQGVSNRGLAVVLGISEGTAKLHVAAVLNRLGVSSRDQVAGLLPAPGIDNAH